MTERIESTCKILKKCQIRLSNWKEKAVNRNKEIIALKKQLEETRSSRAVWKLKYYQSQLLCEEYERELRNSAKYRIATQSVRNHSYDFFTMNLCLELKQVGQLSLRSCLAVLGVVLKTFCLELKLPCINTIRNWENKQGYYNLHLPCTNQDDYVLIADESYCIGSQTLLLFLGVNLSNYDFTSSLDFSDVELLGLSVGASWDGEAISQEIEAIQLNRSYKLKYCCSDGGGNLRKAFRLKELERVADCTHYFSKLIEKRYKTDDLFQSFIKACALLNRQNYMGQDTGICPPKLRGKSRFLNLYTLAKWGKTNLDFLKKLSACQATAQEQRIYDKLLWLQDYKDLIKTLNLLVNKLEAIFKVLKTKGLTSQTANELKQIVASKQVPEFFKKGTEEYIEEHQALILTEQQLICCSDIIESHFGKFKNQQKKNPDKGLTINCLTIANYNKKMEPKEFCKAMEEVKIIDLELWKVDNKLQTFVAKKRELYKNVG